MNWLPLLPTALLIVILLADSVLRRGRTRLPLVIASGILLGFYVDTPQMNQIANERPTAAAARITAVCVAVVVVYFLVTFKQKKVSNCTNCGVTLTLFNRDLSTSGLCAKCGKTDSRQAQKK